jgi:hypothetical protein
METWVSMTRYHVLDHDGRLSQPGNADEETTADSKSDRAWTSQGPRRSSRKATRSMLHSKFTGLHIDTAEQVVRDTSQLAFWFNIHY